MTRQYAVTVTAGATKVKPEVLARRLAELMHHPVDEVLQAVEQNTVVLGGELSYGEALEVQRELSRRKIPSRVCAEQELTGQERWLQSAGQSGGEVPRAPLAEESTEQWEQSQPAPSEDTEDSRAEEAAEVSAWGELFPDLAEPSEPSEPSRSLDDREKFDEEVPDFGAESAPTGESSTLPELDALEEEGGQMVVEELEFDDDAEDVEVGEDWQVPADEGALGFGADTGRKALPEEDGPGDEAFDAAQIHQAFMGDEERPPYEPKGYDPRPDHVPLVAALLSLLAPGSGQVFNGQPEKAQRFAATFFLIYPWIQAVRQAMGYGEKIRTYYAPRPPEGTAKKALSFAVKWWVAVGISFMVLSSMVSMIYDHVQNQRQQRDARTLQQLIYYAEDTVADGVADARGHAEEFAEELAAVAREERRKERDGVFTMDDEERARRLFVIGYHYCQGRNYALCQELMSRVTALVPSNRDAFRLQAWAGIQERSDGPPDPMPEVDGHVPTLEEFERELATEGVGVEELDEDFHDWWDGGGSDAFVEEGDYEAPQGEYGEWWDDWLDDEQPVDDDSEDHSPPDAGQTAN